MQINELLSRVSKIPRVNLVNLPTPFQAMPRLSKCLNGPQLWIKRDDCTGLALGGNKERKMEFVMADALSKRADVVITTGPIQSNHARTTAAAAKKLGLKAILVLRGKKPKDYSGNLLLDYLLGADVRFVQADWQEARSVMEEMAEEVKSEGHIPYIIPGGASYPVGAVAYVNAMAELLRQAEDIGIEINYLIHAAGSGGTQAGLVLGNKILKTKVKILGICVEPGGDQLARETAEIACGAAKILDSEAVTLNDVTLIEDYVGQGYEVLTREIVETIKLVAQTEGIFLDPVYTGKAMSGLIDMIKQRRFKKNDNIVFIHTGGTPSLFVYSTMLRSLH